MEKRPLTQIRISRQVAHEKEKEESPRETPHDVVTGAPSDMINGFKYGFTKHFYQPLFSYKNIKVCVGKEYTHYTRVGKIDTTAPHVYSKTYQFFKNIAKPIGFILGKLCLGIPFQIKKDQLL